MRKALFPILTLIWGTMAVLSLVLPPGSFVEGATILFVSVAVVCLVISLIGFIALP